MTVRPALAVFSDDWGRHPSSCQHLVKELLPKYDVFWFDTIGTRPIRFDLYTLRRGIGKIDGWLRSTARREADERPAPTVVRPYMWPSFRTPFARSLNRRLLARSVAVRLAGRDAVFLTTIPIVADLVGAVPAKRWVYYCVDDFSVWPGLDADTLRSMEAELISKVDRLAAVSEPLRARISEGHRRAELLTHGVDTAFWNNGGRSNGSFGFERPVILFWGLIDARLNVDWVECLSQRMTAGTIAMVGPRQNADPRLDAMSRVRLLGPVEYAQLPALAAGADVLIMPYADLPVTRAMQPLKFKEYLATGRATVAARLPATEEWADAADLVKTADEFATAVLRSAKQGCDASQLNARMRLKDETWASKAQVLERLWLDDPS
jgi:hypothetical protein